MNKALSQKGFTLIEILIALTVFAILASITSSTLYYAFNTRNRINDQAARLNKLQLAISLIQQDIPQIVNRSVRGNEMRLLPALVGLTHHLEFTRDGNENPKSTEKRSTLKRVAFICEKGQLLRRTWAVLDSVNRNKYEERVLFTDLQECHFNYLNQNLQLLSEWREQSTNSPNQRKESLPKAIQINISPKSWGEMNLLFIIPGALYAAN